MADTMWDDDLTEWLDQPDSGDDLPVALDDVERVDWLLRRLGRIRHERAEVVELAEAERQRITDWQADRDRTLGDREAWVAGQLESWMRARNQRDAKAKTVSLPHGKLALRAGRTRVEWQGTDDQLADLERDYPALVRVARVLAKAEAVKVAVADETVLHKTDDPEARAFGARVDGELIDGLVIIPPGPDTFTATPTTT